MSRSLTIQSRVVWALLLREIKTRFGRHRLGYLWAVLGPCAQVVVMMIVFEVLGRLAPPGLDFPVFLITGIVPWHLFNSTVTRSLSAIDSNRALLVYPRVKPLDLVIARSILEVATYVVVLGLLLALAGALGMQAWPDRPLVIIATMLAVSLLGAGIGAAVAAAQAVAPTTQRLVPLTQRPLFFTSGIFFSAEVMPEPLRGWLLFNPLLHANELMRAGFFASYEGRYADPAYLMAWVLGALFTGLLVQRAFRRRVTVPA